MLRTPRNESAELDYLIVWIGYDDVCSSTAGSPVAKVAAHLRQRFPITGTLSFPVLLAGGFQCSFDEGQAVLSDFVRVRGESS